MDGEGWFKQVCKTRDRISDQFGAFLVEMQENIF